MNDAEDGAGSSTSEQSDPGGSRRERQRQVTLAEITDSAQRQLTSEGARGFSLRAVARDIGLAPSAIYRYFDSQNALVATVAVNASRSAGDLMREALVGLEAAPVDERLSAVFAAYRTWALTHPGEFELLFATDQELLADVTPPSSPSWLHRLVEIPLEVLLEAPHPPRPRSSATPDDEQTRLLAAPASALVAELEDRHGRPISEDASVAVISAWLSIHGYVSLERFGQLSLLLADPDARFDEHLTQVVAQLVTTTGSTIGWS